MTLLIKDVSGVRHMLVSDTTTTLTHVITLICHFLKLLTA